MKYSFIISVIATFFSVSSLLIGQEIINQGTPDISGFQTPTSGQLILSQEGSRAPQDLQGLTPSDDAMKQLLKNARVDPGSIDWRKSAFSPTTNWQNLQFKSEMRISFPWKYREAQHIADGTGIWREMPDGSRVLETRTIAVQATHDPLGRTYGAAQETVSAQTSKGEQAGNVTGIPVTQYSSGQGSTTYVPASRVPEKNESGEPLVTEKPTQFNVMRGLNLPPGDSNDFIVTYDNPEKELSTVPGTTTNLHELYTFSDGKRSTNELNMSVSAPVIGGEVEYGFESIAQVTVKVGIMQDDLIRAAQTTKNVLPIMVQDMIVSVHPEFKGKIWVECTRSFEARMEKAYAGSLEVTAPIKGVKLAAGATYTRANFKSNTVKLLSTGDLANRRLADTKSFNKKTGTLDLDHYINACWAQFSKKDIDREWNATKGFYSKTFQNLIYKADPEEKPCSNVDEVLPAHPLHSEVFGERKECVQLDGHPKGVGVERFVWDRVGKPCFLFKDGGMTRATDREMHLDAITNTWVKNEPIGWERHVVGHYTGAHFCSPTKKLRCAARYEYAAWMSGRCVKQKDYDKYIKNGWMSWEE